MLATALGVCACQQGRRVRFTTLAGLANELQEADSRRELRRAVGRYAPAEAAADLYSRISRLPRRPSQAAAMWRVPLVHGVELSRSSSRWSARRPR